MSTRARNYMGSFLVENLLLTIPEPRVRFVVYLPTCLAGGVSDASERASEALGTRREFPEHEARNMQSFMQISWYLWVALQVCRMI